MSISLISKYSNKPTILDIINIVCSRHFFPQTTTCFQPNCSEDNRGIQSLLLHPIRIIIRSMRIVQGHYITSYMKCIFCSFPWQRQIILNGFPQTKTASKTTQLMLSKPLSSKAKSIENKVHATLPNISFEELLSKIASHPLSLSCHMQNHVLMDRVIMALDCIMRLVTYYTTK